MKKLLSSLLFLFVLSFNALAQLSTSPDVFTTSEGDLTVYAVNHGSVAFTFADKTILVDPFGGAELFSEFDAPDIIFITDIHGDHLNAETLEGLDTENTTFVVPQAVADKMDEKYQDQLVVIGNGENTELHGIKASAIPMYNLPEDESSRHTKGRGNGYILTFGGMNVYLSGDTEDIPEMRALTNIDIAFVCMNLPYTMDINQAASAVLEFKPAVMYPYHHRGQDIEAFKKLVTDKNIDVRLKNWYSN